MKTALAKYVVGFIALSLCTLLPVATLYLDIVVLDNDIGETGATESLQHFLILMLIVVFGRRAARRPDQRGLLIMITGFFIVVFIRETDYFSDYILHGIWKYPAVLVTLVSIILARRANGTFMQPAITLARSHQGLLLMSGLAILLFFSRVFGTGQLWNSITSNATDYFIVKTAVQEGTELLGYILLTLGAFYKRSKDKT